MPKPCHPSLVAAPPHSPRRRFRCTAWLLAAALGSGAVPAQPTPADELLARLNAHRREHGLPPIARSASLTRVAEAHVADLERNPPFGACNGHSWSPSRRWKACCYTEDHAQSACMWGKPAEITGGVYTGYGFEIWAWHRSAMTVDFAHHGWLGSDKHREVIVNRGPWAQWRWLSFGAALSQHYAVVWFGREADPDPGR